MIPAQRFQSLDKETNLGIINPLSVQSNDIFNTITNELSSVTSGVSDFVKSIQQSVSSPMSSLTSLLGQGMRTTRDAFSSLTDVSGFSTTQVESAVAGMLPQDRALQNVFRNVTTQCRNMGLGTNSGFKPYDDSANCGRGQGVCNSSEIRNLLDKLTGGAFSAIARTLNSLLKQILALGRMGYNAGLCKIFGELIKGMPSNIVQRGAAGLLGLVGSAGNTTAVLDITANMGNAIPSLEIPGLTGIAMSNFKMPVNDTANTAKDLQEGYFTAMDSILPDWNRSSDKTMLSLANVGDSKSPELQQLLETSTSRTGLDINNLSSVASNEIDSFAAAYKSPSSMVSSLTSSFSSFFS